VFSTIEKFEGGVRVERFDDRAIRKLMYFGKTRDVSVQNGLDKGHRV
jgi:hypothetical protein